MSIEAGGAAFWPKKLLFDKKISRPNDGKKCTVLKMSLFVSQMLKTQDSKNITSPLPNTEKNINWILGSAKGGL